MTTLLARARAFAIAEHDRAGQVRRYTGEPYWTHCERVAALVQIATDDADAAAAAWLHDVLEDCEVPFSRLVALFGTPVATLVMQVTKAADPAGTLHRLAQADPLAQTIKVADIIDNCSTLAARDPGRAPGYFRQKRAQVGVLIAADAGLRRDALAIIGEG